MENVADVPVFNPSDRAPQTGRSTTSTSRRSSRRRDRRDPTGRRRSRRTSTGSSAETSPARSSSRLSFIKKTAGNVNVHHARRENPSPRAARQRAVVTATEFGTGLVLTVARTRRCTRTSTGTRSTSHPSATPRSVRRPWCRARRFERRPAAGCRRQRGGRLLRRDDDRRRPTHDVPRSSPSNLHGSAARIGHCSRRSGSVTGRHTKVDVNTSTNSVTCRCRGRRSRPCRSSTRLAQRDGDRRKRLHGLPLHDADVRARVRRRRTSLLQRQGRHACRKRTRRSR